MRISRLAQIFSFAAPTMCKKLTCMSGPALSLISPTTERPPAGSPCNFYKRYDIQSLPIQSPDAARSGISNRVLSNPLPAGRMRTQRRARWTVNGQRLAGLRLITESVTNAPIEIAPRQLGPETQESITCVDRRGIVEQRIVSSHGRPGLATQASAIQLFKSFQCEHRFRYDFTE
jgi:hypothetical protein